MSVLVFLLPSLFISLLGWLIVMLLDPPRGGEETLRGRVERAALAPLLGTTVLLTWSLLLSCLGIRLTVPWILAAAGLPLPGLVVRFLRPSPTPVRSVPPPAGVSLRGARRPAWSWVSWSCAVLAVLLLAAMIGSLIVEPMVEWDAVAMWAYRARVIHATGTLAPSVANWSAEVVAHPDYPPGIPLLEALEYWCSPATPDDRFAKMALIPFVIGLALVAFSHGEGITRGLGPITALIALAIPAGVVRWSAGSLASGYADFPLAALIAGASWLGCRAVERKDDRAACFAALLAGGAACVKNEGLSFAVIMIVALALVRSAGMPGPWRRLASSVVRTAAPAILVIGPWLILRSRLPPVPGDFDLRGAFRVILSHDLSRAGQIMLAFAKELADVTHWLLLWPVVVIAWLAVPRARTRPFLFLAVCLAGQLLSYASVYLVSPEPVDWLVATSLKRLILHVAPLAALWVTPALPHLWLSARARAEMPD